MHCDRYGNFTYKFVSRIFDASFRFRVLVMGDGEILEFDEPNLLIHNADSYFYQLASQEFSNKE